MTSETVQTVEVGCPDRTLRVRLVGGGEPWYETVNHTLTGVEWHTNLGAFWFDMKNRERCAHWLANLLEELENEIDVRLQLDSATSWKNVTDEVKREIESATGRIGITQNAGTNRHDVYESATLPRSIKRC